MPQYLLESNRKVTNDLETGEFDRLTHHAEIISIEGESYRKREAEQVQKAQAGAEAEAVITPPPSATSVQMYALVQERRHTKSAVGPMPREYLSAPISFAAYRQTRSRIPCVSRISSSRRCAR
jgi:hypothetical protein